MVSRWFRDGRFRCCRCLGKLRGERGGEAKVWCKKRTRSSAVSPRITRRWHKSLLGIQGKAGVLGQRASAREKKRSWSSGEELSSTPSPGAWGESVTQPHPGGACGHSYNSQVTASSGTPGRDILCACVIGASEVPGRTPMCRGKHEVMYLPRILDLAWRPVGGSGRFVRCMGERGLFQLVSPRWLRKIGGIPSDMTTRELARCVRQEYAEFHFH